MDSTIVENVLISLHSGVVGEEEERNKARDTIDKQKGASAEVAFLSFFTRHDPFFHHAKFQLPLRPPSTFLGVF